jgi:NADH-ubiquinone oxidoreductase chain 6
MFINVKSLVIELLVINAIVSAILVIISKNPVISVIFLISLVLNSALFLIAKGMPFLGISYILVYLGAIIVLFLFVILMINIKLTDILETGYQYTKNIPLAIIVSALFLYEIFNILPSTTALLNSEVIFSNDSWITTAFKETIFTLNSIYINSLSFLGLTSAPQEEAVSNLMVSSLLNELPLITNNNLPETLINNSHSAQQIVSVAYNLYTYGAF